MITLDKHFLNTSDSAVSNMIDAVTEKYNILLSIHTWIYQWTIVSADFERKKLASLLILKIDLKSTFRACFHSFIMRHVGIIMLSI